MFWPLSFQNLAQVLFSQPGLDRLNCHVRRAIAPFHRLIVYPAVIRKVQSAWAQRYGEESDGESLG